jgi:Flp pilus assembly protein TadG
MHVRGKRSESGSSIVEMALLAPWIFFLFIGIFDLGFYLYAASCAQSAARIAAIQTASNPGLSSGLLQSMACNAAMLEMVRVPNTHTISRCDVAPLMVTQQTLTNSTTPACADCGPLPNLDPTGVSSLVTVTYQSGLFVPIPGLLKNQLNLTRTSETRMMIP